jgi:conjugative transfer signal peptidase TraF
MDRSRASCVRHVVGIVIGIGLMAACSIQTSQYKLVYNPSASAPRGWYVVKPATTLRTGWFALVRLPPAIAHLADQRRYLPMGTPLIKRVSAIGGDQVCEKHGVVRVNGITVAHSLKHDRAGRPLVAWHGCRALAATEVFLVSTTNAASYDSRYYGPLALKAVIGEAIPVWNW